MKKMKTKMLALLLTFVMGVSLTACSGGGTAQRVVQAKNLMEGIEKSPDLEYTVIDEALSDDIRTAVTDFSVRLFKQSYEEGENTLVSPLSVLMALSMTANGAKGETLTQMEETFGADIPNLNTYLSDYVESLPQGDKYKLSLANSIWFTNDESFNVNQDFLQTNADWYNADVYQAPFDDSTVEDINQWINMETDGMISEVLKEIPADAVMYLVNALAFEAEWQCTYEDHEVRNSDFTTESGEKQPVEMMYSGESVYLEDENTTGFMKYYKDKKYAFVALLPDEGISIGEYIKGLSSEKIAALLKNPQTASVQAGIPKFETESDILMNDVLKEMGITNAFKGADADFTGVGTSTVGNIFISRVMHKTYIQMGPQGTKAGAATVVEMQNESVAMYDKEVYLNRPFVYLLIDCENNQPFFIGALETVE